MLKKITALLLAVGMLSAVLASCSVEKTETKVYDDNYRNYYEIYVRSFSDSNGDGIGDLQGVISKLDYLKAPEGQDDSRSLGIDGVWLMPVFTSPSQHKYDVTNYYEIDPSYGTMADFEELIRKFHERGIRLIIDLVLNHTSNEHPWFIQAVKDINSGNFDSKYAKYYNFTTEPELDEDGNPKGYSAVEGNEEGYYYESRFVYSMPDLNLDSPDVWAEIKDIMKFWLDKGVDGFRLDACKYFFTNPMDKSIEFLSKVVDYGKSVNPNCYFVGEVWDSAYIISQYYKSGIDSIFNFDCSYSGPYAGLFNNIDNGNGEKIGRRLEQFNSDIRNQNINAIDAPFISNHDTPRSGTYHKGSFKRKLAASLYMTLPGNPFIYYGEEIGMSEGWANDSEKRLPIKWSNEESDLKIIRPNGAKYIEAPRFGVFDQLEHEDSLVNHYRRIIKLKKMNPEIQRAQVVSNSDLHNHNVAAYTCAYDHSSVMVIHNLTATPKYAKLRENGYGDYSELSGFVIADDYVEEEIFKAYMKDYEYEVPQLRPKAAPVFYVDGVLTLPPGATVVLRKPGQSNSTFVTTTTTVWQEVSQTDIVTPTDTETTDAESSDSGE